MGQYGFVCIVTGAVQPVGKAIVQELAGKGYCNRFNGHGLTFF
jgi:NAD(P)-dependent dehydrogenase (short-subunit alcohol dehydrogenase family)